MPISPNTMFVPMSFLTELDPTYVSKRVNGSTPPRIDWSKPVRTKIGHFPVKVISTESRISGAPVMVYVGDSNSIRFYQDNGQERSGFGYVHEGSRIPELENVPDFEPQEFTLKVNTEEALVALRLLANYSSKAVRMIEETVGEPNLLKDARYVLEKLYEPTSTALNRLGYSDLGNSYAIAQQFKNK